MIKIGLTGSIGMGKSETAKIFSGIGVPVYDADASVHKLYEAGNKGALAIKNLYPEAISIDGSVDRKVLGGIVVGNKNKIKKLEEIIHPLVWDDRNKFLKQMMLQKRNIVVARDAILPGILLIFPMPNNDTNKKFR